MNENIPVTYIGFHHLVLQTCQEMDALELEWISYRKNSILTESRADASLVLLSGYGFGHIKADLN